MRKREEAAKAVIMHARWAAMRRRRMSTYPVLRRIAAVPLSEALISGSQDDPPACPPCGATMTRATPPMTMAVSAPMTQTASRSVAATASAVLGARGVGSVIGAMGGVSNGGPEVAGVHPTAGVGHRQSPGTPAHGPHERAPEQRTVLPSGNHEPVRWPLGPPHADRFASRRPPPADGTPRPAHHHVPQISRGRRG